MLRQLKSSWHAPDKLVCGIVHMAPPAACWQHTMQRNMMAKHQCMFISRHVHTAQSQTHSPSRNAQGPRRVSTASTADWRHAAALWRWLLAHASTGACEMEPWRAAEEEVEAAGMANPAFTAKSSIMFAPTLGRGGHRAVTCCTAAGSPRHPHAQQSLPAPERELRGRGSGTSTAGRHIVKRLS